MCGIREVLPSEHKLSILRSFVQTKLPNIYLTDSQLYGCVQFLDNSFPGWEALLAMFPFLEIFINLLLMIERGNIPTYQPQTQSEAIVHKPERTEYLESESEAYKETMVFLGEIFNW